MKAVRAHRGGGPEYLFIEAAPLPKIRRGNVLLRMRAWHHARGTALTRDATYQNADGRPRIPGIPGHEISEVVERTATDVTDFRPGEEIIDG